MHIDNADRKAPAQFNEHEALDVSRRIERDEGSTYRINGREVRARDVHILFADASTGSRSPALVHQGRIGEIIQAKPEQRRRVLEEAAGISGLHARRHEAELRLRAAEQNLLRLEDVINQLATQMAALKTQARQAVRYRNIADQIRKAEATLFHLRWVAANTEHREAEQVKDQAIRLVAERTGTQAEASTRQANVAAGLPALREAEARAAAALQRLVIARETLEQEETRAKNRMAELDQRLIQLTGDVEREQRLAADAEAALARLATEEDSLRADLHTSMENRTGANERVTDADTVLAQAEQSFGTLTGTLAELTARRSQLKAAVRTHSERLAKLDFEITSVNAELRQLADNDNGTVDLDALSSVVDQAPAAVADAEAAALRRGRIRRHARRSTWRASRSPKPSAARSGSTPRPRHSPSSCTSRRKISGRP
jgi:chromosome segregation protein